MTVSVEYNSAMLSQITWKTIASFNNLHLPSIIAVKIVLGSVALWCPAFMVTSALAVLHLHARGEFLSMSLVSVCSYELSLDGSRCTARGGDLLGLAPRTQQLVLLVGGIVDGVLSKLHQNRRH